MMTKQIIKKTQRRFSTAVCLSIVLLSASGAISAQVIVDDIVDDRVAPAQTDRDYNFSEVVTESVTGDVYSDKAAANWQDLSYSNLFSKGWDKPWVSPPNGGGAPRQGWLNSYDGVFYRLGIAIFGWQHDLVNNGDGYTGNLLNYTPLNQRFEVATEIPLSSNRGTSGSDSQTNFGDFRITPRLILSESKDVTQSFGVTFRTPTGNVFNGNHVAAITPQYQFWANSWKGLVVRGGRRLHNSV